MVFVPNADPRADRLVEVQQRMVFLGMGGYGTVGQLPVSSRKGSKSILARPNVERHGPSWKFSNTRSISRRRVWKGSHSRIAGALISFSSVFGGGSVAGFGRGSPALSGTRRELGRGYPHVAVESSTHSGRGDRIAPVA